MSVVVGITGGESKSVLVVTLVAISVPLKALSSLLDVEVWSGGSWEVWVLVSRVSHVVNESIGNLDERFSAGIALTVASASALSLVLLLSVVVSNTFHGDVLVEIFVSVHSVSEEFALLASNTWLWVFSAWGGQSTGSGVNIILELNKTRS